MKTIRSVLAQTLSETGLSLKDLERSSQISYTTLWKLYHNKTTRVDFLTLQGICNALDVQVNKIIDCSPEP